MYVPHTYKLHINHGQLLHGTESTGKLCEYACTHFKIEKEAAAYNFCKICRWTFLFCTSRFYMGKISGIQVGEVLGYLLPHFAL